MRVLRMTPNDNAAKILWKHEVGDNVSSVKRSLCFNFMFHIRKCTFTNVGNSKYR